MALDYEPLDVDSYEIRMLTILPGPPESTVKCTMDRTNLISPVYYAALSYCWGDTALTTHILVNGIRTPVTTNLADALQHLRKLGVSRLWVDALCINQNDKQEKGLQIRNMKHIFSRAELTYGWLGREDADDTTAAITFLMSLLNSHDGTALAPGPHTCVSTPQQQRRRWRTRMASAKPSPHQTRPQKGGCPRCTTEVRLRGLQHLLQRQYWKRRWIIQESSVSYKHILLCGDAAITLDEMDQAITKCQTSCYWDLGIRNVCSWFKTITKFRYFHQVEVSLSLCQAIALSRQFESTDSRDAIFSLLGLCYDGPELVPTPNYLQSIETIVTDLTRALIRKHKHLDFLLINGTIRTSSEVLPSWVPDWFNGDIPSQAYSLADMTTQRANTRFYLGNSIGQTPPTDGRVLQVRGLTVGRIVTMTTSTDPTDVSLLFSSQSTNSVPSFDSLTSVYYTDCQVFRALLSCLISSPEGQHMYHYDRLPADFNARLVWHVFCLQFVSPKTRFSQHSQISSDSEKPTGHSKEIFSKWLKANAKFKIHGRNLEEWTQERTFSWLMTLMWILDSSLAIPFWMLLVLGPLAGAITVNIMISTRPGIIVGMTLYLVSVCDCLLLLFYSSYIRVSKPLWNDDLTQLVKPGKILFVTDKGYIGIADDRAKIGDMLCNLVGCSEPVVLREIGGDTDGDNEQERRQRKNCAVVGKCYVHFTKQEADQYLGPDPFFWGSTEKQRSKYERKKEEWLRNPAKGIWKEFDLI